MQAYIRSYVGPLLPDVAPPQRSEDTYTPRSSVEVRPQTTIETSTRIIDIPSARPETMGRPLVSIPYPEHLPKGIHAKAAEAQTFIREHLTRDIQTYLETLWNLPNIYPMRYVVVPGDTIESIAANA